MNPMRTRIQMAGRPSTQIDTAKSFAHSNGRSKRQMAGRDGLRTSVTVVGAMGYGKGRIRRMCFKTCHLAREALSDSLEGCSTATFPRRWPEVAAEYRHICTVDAGRVWFMAWSPREEGKPGGRVGDRRRRPLSRRCRVTSRQIWRGGGVLDCTQSFDLRSCLNHHLLQ
jgi:hypothetical protein